MVRFGVLMDVYRGTLEVIDREKHSASLLDLVDNEKTYDIITATVLFSGCQNNTNASRIDARLIRPRRSKKILDMSPL